MDIKSKPNEDRIMKHNRITVTLEGQKPIHFEIGHDIPKADEIQLMELLEKSFAGTDTYLVSLFSPALTTWVSGQIRSDFPPDAADWLIGAKFKAEEKILSLQAEITRLNNTLDFVQRDSKDKISARDEIVEGLRVDLARQKEDDDKAMAETLGDLSVVKHELNVANALLLEKKQEIIELKAKLFDMIVKEGR